MLAGQLRHRVVLQAPSALEDAYGQPVIGWVAVATIWAQVRYLSGLSAIKSGADTSISKVSIRARYRAFTPEQRVLYGTGLFAIEAVLPDERKRYVDLVCREISP